MATGEPVAIAVDLGGTQFRVAAVSPQPTILHRLAEPTRADAEPDVVIADIAMPDYNGFALIAQIREEDSKLGRTTPAIALTAFTSAADQERALSAGFQEYMSKPFDPGELIATVSKLLHPPGASDIGSSAA